MYPSCILSPDLGGRGGSPSPAKAAVIGSNNIIITNETISSFLPISIPPCFYRSTNALGANLRIEQVMVVENCGMPQFFPGEIAYAKSHMSLMSNKLNHP